MAGDGFALLRQMHQRHLLVGEPCPEVLRDNCRRSDTFLGSRRYADKRSGAISLLNAMYLFESVARLNIGR